MRVWFNKLYRGCLKRLIDIILVLLGLPLVLPSLTVIVIIVYWKYGLPVLFRQQRPGLHGRSFFICKFRTMTDERDIGGKLLPDAERLTRFGEFLRSTSLDELPELWNVLKGDMSLVGPRPLLMKYLDYYSPEQMRRHDVKPGITGWAQINGRNNISWQEKFKMDIYYVDNHSFLLDLRIIILTLWKTIRREDINQEGEATVKYFTGNGDEISA